MVRIAPTAAARSPERPPRAHSIELTARVAPRSKGHHQLRYRATAEQANLARFGHFDLKTPDLLNLVARQASWTKRPKPGISFRLPHPRSCCRDGCRKFSRRLQGRQVANA